MDWKWEKTPQGDVTVGLDNMDAHVDPDELDDVARFFDETATNFKLLTFYARSKAQAMKLRKAGDIPTALKVEKRCEEILKRIPEAFRW